MKQEVESLQNRTNAKEGQGYYERLFDVVGVAVCVIDEQGIIEHVNRHWEKSLGYAKNEAEGLLHWSQLIAPEELERFRGCFVVKKHQTPSVLEEYRTRLIDKSGNVKHVVCTINKISGTRKHVLSAMDITESVTAAEQIEKERNHYHDLFENVPVAISEEDESGMKKYFDSLRAEGVEDFRDYFSRHPEKLHYCSDLGKGTAFNRASFEILEATNYQEMIDIMARSFKNDTVFAHAHGDTLIRLAEGQTHFCKEEEIITARGEVKTVRCYVTIPPGHEENLSRVYICYFDITDLKKANDELKEYKAKLEQLVEERTCKLESSNMALKKEINKHKTTAKKLEEKRSQLREQFEQRIHFTLSLVHEIKTFLTPLIAASEIMQQHTEDGSLKRLSDTIFSAVTGLESRVEELFDYAHGEIGDLGLHCSSVQPASVLQNVRDYAANMALKNKQVFQSEISLDLPLLWADEERLMQILLNLLNNAFKYTQQGGNIKLRAWHEGKLVFFQVADDGPGVNVAGLSRIFEPEYRKKNKSRGSSMGIGLPLSSMLAKLHGGRIEVESSESAGSKFTLVLPAKEMVQQGN